MLLWLNGSSLFYFFPRTVHFFLEFCIVIIIVTISQNLKNGLAEVELPP